MGRVLVAMAQPGGGEVNDLNTFDPNAAPSEDYTPAAALALAADPGAGNAVTIGADPLLGWLWAEAVREFTL